MKNKIKKGFLWSQKYTKTDMIYLAKGGFWETLSKVFIALLSFASMIAFAHWLPKKLFGEYQYVVSTVGIISIFTLSGMGKPLTTAIARGKEKTLILACKERIKWGSISSLISFCISGWYLYNNNLILGIAFLIAGVFLPFTRSFNLFTSFWQGKKKFDVSNKYLMMSNFLEALVLIT